MVIDVKYCFPSVHITIRYKKLNCWVIYARPLNPVNCYCVANTCFKYSYGPDFYFTHNLLFSIDLKVIKLRGLVSYTEFFLMNDSFILKFSFIHKDFHYNSQSEEPSILSWIKELYIFEISITEKPKCLNCLRFHSQSLHYSHGKIYIHMICPFVCMCIHCIKELVLRIVIRILSFFWIKPWTFLQDWNLAWNNLGKTFFFVYIIIQDWNFFFVRKMSLICLKVF